jgi:hypothetical protein
MPAPTLALIVPARSIVPSREPGRRERFAGLGGSSTVIVVTVVMVTTYCYGRRTHTCPRRKGSFLAIFQYGGRERAIPPATGRETGLPPEVTGYQPPTIQIAATGANLDRNRFAPARRHLRVCGHWMARVQVGRRVRTANPANLVFRSDGGEMLRSRPPYRGMAGKDPFRLWPPRAPAKRVIDANLTRTRACGRFDAGSRSIGERGAASGRNGRRRNSSAGAGLRAICPTNP